MNHGRVVRELAEYREKSVRVVVCELQDGWHVVETYRSGEIARRHVTKAYPDAVFFAREQLPSVPAA